MRRIGDNRFEYNAYKLQKVPYARQFSGFLSFSPIFTLFLRSYVDGFISFLRDIGQRFYTIRLAWPIIGRIGKEDRRGAWVMRGMLTGRPHWKSYVFITLLVALMTALLHPFGLAFDLVNIALIYLFPVLLSAVYWGIRPAFYAAVLGVLAFDFFFVPPVISFTISDLRYLVSFGVYLSVAALTASLAARLKQQLLLSRQREAHTAALYELSRRMNAISDVKTLLDNVAKQVSRIVGAEAAIFLPDERGILAFAHASSPDASGPRSSAADEWGRGDAERVIATRVYGNGEPAGIGTAVLGESTGYYLPLRTETRVYGVMALRLGERRSALPAEQLRLIEALSDLTAGALARVKLAEEAKIAHLSAESEKLRTAILDSVSHELRTPLAAIIGSATSLIEGDRLFSSEDRMELLATIRDGALRMNRLSNNLLSMARLESGMLKLRKDWCDAEDLIGVALSQINEFRQQRTIRVHVPEDVPMVLGDEVLLEQMLVNVLSNAIKYSPDRSEIVLTARAEEDSVALSVADQGTGLPESEYARIFDKFYRAESSGQATGTGLGLAICKGIAELHGGTIFAKPNVPHGTVVTIVLPLDRRNERAPIPHGKGTIEYEQE